MDITKISFNFAIAILTILTGCATPHVVQTVRPSDSGMTCHQIELEIAEAERFRSDASKEKGMTGTNVAAALFFWPAMIGTYSNANDAISAADTRKSHLSGIYMQKKCGERVQENEAGGVSKISKGEKTLIELRKLLDKGLITKDEYDTKRIKILSEM